MGAALGHIRICDFTGQLAGAGATRWLAAFGAQVIRIEDPVMRGKWDILRGSPPFKDERRGLEFGVGFQNHNVEKLGVTLNLRTERGKELLAELVKASDVVAENFAAGVLERWGFGYDHLKELKEDIVYVSNCGFGQEGPYGTFKSWGPIAQAVSGMTFESGLPDQPPAGWGYSYMDHTGGYVMAIAILAALVHRNRTGEGQWVDLSCTEAGAALTGTAVLDSVVNGRARRGPGRPNSNRSVGPAMAPHGVFPCSGEDNWVAIACRNDDDWTVLASIAGLSEPRWRHAAGRLADEDAVEAAVAAWTTTRSQRRGGRGARKAPRLFGPTPRRTDRRGSGHLGVRLVAHRGPPGDGRGAGRRLPGALLRDRLAHGAGRPLPGPAQRRGVGRDPGPQRRRGRPTASRRSYLMSAAQQGRAARAPASPMPMGSGGATPSDKI